MVEYSEKTGVIFCKVFSHSVDIVAHCELLELSLSTLLESIEDSNAIANKQANLLIANMAIVELIKEQSMKIKDLV